MLKGKLLLTGGAGTLGKAIIRRSAKENWDCHITIFSTDAIKHAAIRREYPQVQSVIGDVRDFTSLMNVMTGKDIVLHLAAVKHIPVSEVNSIDTFDVNVQGSLNICLAAMQLNTPHVLGISTDKACHAANAYGATKYLMEKVFQEYARLGLYTQFHLVRYGNVLESTGSVIEAWKRTVSTREPIKITDPEMTRFWLSPSQAVDYVIVSLEYPSGHIFIPKMPALSIGQLAEYVLEEGFSIERVPLRPGEKMHETLLTCEEGHYADEAPNSFMLAPTTTPRYEHGIPPYTSDTAPQLTREGLMELLKD